MAQDAGRPEFWEERYRNGVTPWDAGGAPAAFCAWLAKERAPLSVLVPGCGSGYEVRALAEQGHDVLAIDFSEAAVEAARRQAHGLRARIRHEDFFQLSEPPVEVLYERTFMCALPPRMRAAWAEHVQALVRPGGRLLGFFFFDAQPKGPPFGIAPSALHALLDPGFALLVDEPVPAAQSVPVLAGKERWQVWQRRL